MLWTFPTTIWYIRLLSYFVILSCLSIYLSHTLFWKINKKTELENTNRSQTLHTQCILYLDEKEKGNMIIWIAINNPPKLTLMSQYQPIFWVSEIKEPIHFLLLLLQLRKQSFAKQTRVFVPPILIIIHHDWIEIQHLWYVRVQSILNHGFRRSNQTFIWEFFR